MDRSSPIRPSGRRRRQLALVGTDHAARVLDVPARTIRRWAMQRDIGQVVASRRMLTTHDIEALRQLRDQLPAGMTIG